MSDVARHQVQIIDQRHLPHDFVVEADESISGKVGDFHGSSQTLPRILTQTLHVCDI